MKAILTLPFVILLGFIPAIGEAQYITVSGYVTNLLTGATIENVSVFEKSSGIGTISNEEGYYKLILKPGQVNITFSNDGLEPYTGKFLVSADTTMLVQLKPDSWAKKNDKPDIKLQTEVQNKKVSDRKNF